MSLRVRSSLLGTYAVRAPTTRRRNRDFAVDFLRLEMPGGTKCRHAGAFSIDGSCPPDTWSPRDLRGPSDMTAARSCARVGSDLGSNQSARLRLPHTR